MRFRFSLRLLLIAMAFFAVYFYYFRYFLDLEAKRNSAGQRFIQEGILEGMKESLQRELLRLDNEILQQKHGAIDRWKEARQKLEDVEVELDNFLGVDPLEKAIQRLKSENEIGQGDAGSD
jgi:hypothetical protein